MALSQDSQVFSTDLMNICNETRECHQSYTPAVGQESLHGGLANECFTATLPLCPFHPPFQILPSYLKFPRLVVNGKVLSIFSYML